MNSVIGNKKNKQCFEVIRKFFANTSIRGFSRIVKSETTFLRTLWILFVVSTITFLIVSIFKVVIDYRQYSVNIQTYIQIDNATPFPALTFCNHQPFSERAYQLWEESKVMSPTQFNELFRSEALKQFKDMVRTKMTPKDSDFNHPLFLTTINDRLSVYYQNLPTTVSSELGHNISIIKNCVWSYGQHMAFDNHCQDDMLIVKNISHPSYFNCFTVEPHPKYASIFSRLGLIIWLGPDEQTNIKHRQGFLFDIFEQAYGLRVIIHEPNSYPNIESEGVQIEPGRLNELNYQPELNIKVDTERKPCINEPDRIYRDLDNVFKYDIDLCFNMELQQRIITECKCIYGYYPRYLHPSKELPYCGYLEPEKYHDLLFRKNCITKIFNEAPDIKSNLKADKKCIHSCSSIEYTTTTSVTKWRPTDWQLYWLKEVLDAWAQYYNLMARNINIPSNNMTTTDRIMLQNLTSRIETFFTRKNLSEFIPESEKLLFNERYTFVVVKRKANNTFIKEERLVLSFNALVSRVGGLCSLYIGLTFAFFIELIDFLYTIIFLRKPLSREDSVEKIERTGQKRTSQTLFLKNVHETDQKLKTEITNSPMELENNNMFHGTIYWNVSSKNQINENSNFLEDDNRGPTLSNPWIPIGDDK